ncbi:MAG: macro domain-containing protein [Tissierellia bacterium]|nr:macro domain-containing protein [Tissierellia bacterium]
MKYNNTEISIIKGDITDQKVDAIVNAANNTLLGGSGVDGAIHKKGGRIILEQCKKIGGCPTGEARITTGGNLPCNYVIHTVGPIYDAKSIRNEKLLYDAYYNSLKLASGYNIKSIAFPAISTGAYGYPVKEAIDVVFLAIKGFLENNKSIDKINFVLYNDESYEIYYKYFTNKLNVL